MISFTGSTAVGKRIMAQRRRDAEEGVPRARRQVRQHHPRRRRLRGAVRQRRDGLHARRSGLRDHHAHAAAAVALRRGRRPAQDRVRELDRTATRRDPENLQGPLINARQRERVLGLHREGQGARARGSLVGGGRPQQLDKGYYVEPTLFVDVDPDSTIAQEEIFGPVLAVIPYEDDDDAVRIANNSQLRAVGRGQRHRPRPRVRHRPADPLRHGGGQRRPVVRSRLAVRRLQAESASGASTASPGFEEYLETKTIGLPAPS